jgi:hypothetical protein
MIDGGFASGRSVGGDEDPIEQETLRRSGPIVTRKAKVRTADSARNQL